MYAFWSSLAGCSRYTEAAAAICGQFDRWNNELITVDECAFND